MNVKKLNIYEFDDYKKYLNNWIEVESNKIRGIKSRLAEFIPCHTAYVSHVLNNNAHFSLEQGEKINQFIDHTKNESHFFLLLIQYGRAGTITLKNFFKDQMKAMAQKQFVLKERLSYDRVLSLENQAIYYSQWYYAAIHIVVTIPGIRRPKEISEYLNLGMDLVRNAIEFLEQTGILINIDGEFQTGEVSLHLGNDSQLLSKHHANWRVQTLKALDNPKENDLHFSSIISASEKDSKKIREILIRAIEEIRYLVKSSNEETAYCYQIDFFPLNRK